MKNVFPCPTVFLVDLMQMIKAPWCQIFNSIAWEPQWRFNSTQVELWCKDWEQDEIKRKQSFLLSDCAGRKKSWTHRKSGGFIFKLRASHLGTFLHIVKIRAEWVQVLMLISDGLTVSAAGGGSSSEVTWWSYRVKDDEWSCCRWLWTLCTAGHCGSYVFRMS